MESCQEFFGQIAPVVEQGDFQSLGQGGEFAWFLAGFDPDEVVIEGCQRCGELLVAEACYRLVGQRFLRFGFENICDDLSSIFCRWWARCLVGGCYPL